MAKTTNENVFSMSRGDAADLINNIRNALHDKDQDKDAAEIIRRLIEDKQIPATADCKGEAHKNAHIDHCGACLRSIGWGVSALPVKIR